MKKKILIGLTLAILSMFVAKPVQAEVYTLWAGQHIDVGTVTIENESDTLYVTFETSGDWELVETHVHAAIDPMEIPQTQPNKKGKGGGNPIPGAFQFSEPITDPTIQTYEISLAEIGDSGFDPEESDDLFVAAHAEVIRVHYDCTWQIGDEEASQMDNPADEFNSSPSTGPFDFYVGATPDSEFPWQSKYDTSLANPINIHFNTNMPYGGDFSFSWSPGADSTETFAIMLDGTQVLGTITRNGAPNPAWWGTYERFTDSVEVPPITEDHVLTINFSSGDGNVWDWLRLEGPCVQEETAWAGEIDFPGANWATYCVYTFTPCTGELDICIIPVFMEVGNFTQLEDYDINEIVLEAPDWCESPQSLCDLHAEMEHCDEKKVVLEQVDCGDIGKGAGDYPCYLGCVEFDIRANYEVKLGTRLYKDGDVISDWSAYYDGGDVIPGDCSYHRYKACIKAWNVEIENGPPGDQVQVGTLTITGKPH